MRDELKKYGDEAYKMVEYAAREIGPRLPGSNNEKKYHDYMSDKLKELGLNPVTESFVFAPHASIGGLPYAGWAGIIGCVLTVLATILASLSAYAGLAMHFVCTDRKSTRLNSSHRTYRISYAVFCLDRKSVV